MSISSNPIIKEGKKMNLHKEQGGKRVINTMGLSGGNNLHPPPPPHIDPRTFDFFYIYLKFYKIKHLFFNEEASKGEGGKAWIKERFVNKSLLFKTYLP